MASVKLSVTVRKALVKKYRSDDLLKIDKAVKGWIAADAARGIETVHVALDEAAQMKRLGVPAITGRVTAKAVKLTIDALWKKLGPDYLVLFGGSDVIPYFVVPNPTYDSSGSGDDDVSVRTDNPYACSRPFVAAKRESFLVPDRVVGRIPDMPGDKDPGWLLDHLATATGWVPQPPKTFASTYAICCDPWTEAGKGCMRYIGRPTAGLMIAPPEGDNTPTATGRVRLQLHMIKCHGAKLTPYYYGQKGNAYPNALSSDTVRKKLRPNTIVAAMCCYGAQTFAPSDPRVAPEGAWPIAGAYLRGGAFGFAGSTEIAWVGVSEACCADMIVCRYLKAVVGGASQGRAFLESKQDYMHAIQKQGQAPGREDEKTLLEYVMLGDPSIQPAEGQQRDPAGPAPRRSAAPARMAAARAPAVEAERQQRRIFRMQLGAQIRDALPIRTDAPRAAGARASGHLQAVRQLMASGKGGFRFTTAAVHVDHVETKVSRAQIAAAGLAPLRAAGPGRRRSTPSTSHAIYQYYWSGRREVAGHKQIRLVRIETDAKGNVLRTSMVHSS
ncbi:MAG: hypothetical protein HY898_18850 [Deltaproteobacteria bacterium]|nr:hypothetical protein [Deltaproteobacteria bacterium]